MARIFRVNNDDPLISGLSGANQSAATAMRFRSQRMAEERADRSLKLKEKALDAQIGQAQERQNQAMAQREAAASLYGDQIEGIQGRNTPEGSLAPGQSGPLPEGVDRVTEQRQAFAGRLENAKALMPNLSEPAQNRLLTRMAAEEKQLVMDDAYEDTAQILADAVEDGVFEANPEAAQEIAQLLQQEQAAGRRPDKVNDMIRKQTATFEEEAIVQGEWDEELERANTLLGVAKDRDVRLALQRRIVKAQKNSSRRSGDPERFRSDIDNIALGQDAGRDLRREAFRGTQFDEITGEEEAQRQAEEEARIQEQGGPSFVERVREYADREARGVLDSNRFEDVPNAKRTQLVASIRELVSGQATKTGEGAFGIDVPRPVQNTKENLAALFEEAGVDPASLPPELLKEIVDTGGLKKEHGDVFN